MLTVFFFGIGSASILTGFSQSLLQIGIGLALIGVFASIYHPVGIAMLIERGGKVGWLLGMNGVWGNMGVAGAPLVTGFILAQYDWRMALIFGLSYLAYTRSDGVRSAVSTENKKDQVGFAPGWQRALVSLALVTAAGGFVFGGMTFLIPRLFDVRMHGISADIAVTGTLAAAIYVVAAFAQLIVGRQIDNRSIKPVLIFVACGQPVFLFLMAVYTDYSLFAVSLLAMGFVFGQIPITDAVLSQYVPDQWRTKVLSIKFMINLMIGAASLMTARYLLSSGSGFEPVMQALAISACIVVLAAFLLPKSV
jgi:MFS family permease